MEKYIGLSEMKLSIITINYNNADGLRKTIESVLAQTFTDFEYIIVDGASTDGSVEIIRSNVQNLESSKVKWVSEADKGIYNAMNKGLRMATGEYCLFLNSGDNLHDENVLIQVVPQLESADIYYCDAEFVYPNGTHELHIYPDKLTFDFFYKTALCHQAMFFKAEAIRAAGGYDEYYRVIGDWVLYVKMMILDNCSNQHIGICVSDFNLEGLSCSEEGKARDEKEKEYFYRSTIPARVLEDYNRWNDLEKQNEIFRLKRIHKSYLRKIANLCIRVVHKIDKILR